jgi:hypothetical protein
VDKLFDAEGLCRNPHCYRAKFLLEWAQFLEFWKTNLAPPRSGLCFIGYIERHERVSCLPL